MTHSIRVILLKLSMILQEYILDEIMSSPMVHSPLTKLQCCPTSDGSAAAILVSQDYLVNNPHLIETVNLTTKVF